MDALLRRQNRSREQLTGACSRMLADNSACEYDQDDVAGVRYDALVDVTTALAGLLDLVDVLQAERTAACDRLADALAREDPDKHLGRDGVALAVRMSALVSLGIDCTAVRF